MSLFPRMTKKQFRLLRKKSKGLSSTPTVWGKMDEATCSPKREVRIIRRVFVKETKGIDHYSELGWVLSPDIQECMVCASEFGFVLWKHHCRACGSVICNSCSHFSYQVKEIAELGKVYTILTLHIIYSTVSHYATPYITLSR